MARYRILRGSHGEGAKHYRAGDVVETKNNYSDRPHKFQLVADDCPLTFPKQEEDEAEEEKEQVERSEKRVKKKATKKKRKSSKTKPSSDSD